MHHIQMLRQILLILYKYGFLCFWGHSNSVWVEEPGRLQSMGSQRVRHLLSDFTFTFHFHALENEMATHSSVLAWRVPGMVEPGGLLSMGSHRVGHNWSYLAAAAAAKAIHWSKDSLFNKGCWNNWISKWKKKILDIDFTLFTKINSASNKQDSLS